MTIKLGLALLLVGVLLVSGDTAEPPHGRQCVPTEPMPVLGRGTTPPDHMPIMRIDTTRLDRMPVLRLEPCYLADSNEERPARGGSSRE